MLIAIGAPGVTAPKPHTPLPAFPAAPPGWSIHHSNPKNDYVLGYVGPVLHGPDGTQYIGIDTRWTVLDDLRKAALAAGSNGGHGAWPRGSR
ncbi:MAG: hypothetical protein JWM25_74 [Thermoleophilia bacterium]|nr:hypothetical protein [Thermoleophilia bacterium]